MATSPTSIAMTIRSWAGDAVPLGGFASYDVPGGHSSMLQEPHAKILAEQMQSVIETTLADRPSLPRIKPHDKQSPTHQYTECLS